MDGGFSSHVNAPMISIASRKARYVLDDQCFGMMRLCHQVLAEAVRGIESLTAGFTNPFEGLP